LRLVPWIIAWPHEAGSTFTRVGHDAASVQRAGISDLAERSHYTHVVETATLSCAPHGWQSSHLKNPEAGAIAVLRQ